MFLRIRSSARFVYRAKNIFCGFLYDLSRFLLYAGWDGNMSDKEKRNYNLAMLYHGLEKSMSFENRNPESGWKNAIQILEILKIAYNSENIGYHDNVASKILYDFVQLPENSENLSALYIKRELESFANFDSDIECGAKTIEIDEFRKGVLADPEAFFYSRSSLRNFSGENVSKDVIARAVKLALKTPSVCNRQPWMVYHSSDKAIKKTVFMHQSGNKSFGDQVPDLMVVTSDLKAFFSGEEHSQHWIDGGLFSMSLMYALHSLGVASCALNWCQKPNVDKKVRRLLNIKPSQSIIMVLAVGYPKKRNRVCASPRRPLSEVYSVLEFK